MCARVIWHLQRMQLAVGFYGGACNWSLVSMATGSVTRWVSQSHIIQLKMACTIWIRDVFLLLWMPAPLGPNQNTPRIDIQIL